MAASWNRQALQRVRAAAVDAVEAGARHIEQVSNTRVPDETGALQASSHTSIDRSAGQAVVSYDDAAAVFQHERLDYRHDDGQAKFLESAAVGDRNRTEAVMVGVMRSKVGG